MQRNWLWLLGVIVIVGVGLAIWQPWQGPAPERPSGPTETETPSPPSSPSAATPPAASGEATPPPAPQPAEEAILTEEEPPATPETPAGPPPGASAPAAAPVEIKNPDTLVVADISDIDTLDPHFAYDTSSGEVIFHVYDNLIDYDGPATDRFVPMLATQVPSLDNGLIREQEDGSVVLRFPIRRGVTFHEGGTLSPEDVAYSFWRLMLLDRSNGPSWLVLSPLLEVNTIEDLAIRLEAERSGREPADLTFDQVSAEALEATCRRVQEAVRVDGDAVEFHLPRPFPPFFSIIAHSASWAAVLDREWAIAQGAWDGSCANWVAFHDPQKENDPLYEKMNGTGPFKLAGWDHSTGDVTLVRYEGYWREPAQLARVVIKKVNEWSTRKLMLQNGDADIIAVNRQFIDQVDGMPGVRLIKGQISMSLGFLLFNQKVAAEGNPYIGSGKLDGEGIPPDFFADVDVRKGFNYAFDWETYIDQALKGEAKQARGPIPEGVPYFNPDNPIYRLDLEAAAEHLRRAWDGQVWERGFKFTAVYVSGGEAAKTALEILRRNLRRVNEKFQIEIQNVEWSTLLSKSVEGSLPFYPLGWLEDYHDPHNWVFPLMHSQGTFGATLGFGNKYDALIEQGVRELDPEKRRQVYYELQRLAYEDAIVIFQTQALGRHYQRRWVDGYYFNPIWPGRNFYVMSKRPDAAPNRAYVEALGLVVEEW